MIKKTITYLLVFSLVLLTMVGCNSDTDKQTSIATYTKALENGLTLGVEPLEVEGKTKLTFSCVTDKSVYSTAKFSVLTQETEASAVFSGVLRNKETDKVLKKLNGVGTPTEPCYDIGKKSLDEYLLEYDVDVLLSLPDTDEIKLTWSDDDLFKDIDQKITLPDGKSIVLEMFKIERLDGEDDTEQLQLKIYYSVCYAVGSSVLSCKPQAIESPYSSYDESQDIPYEKFSESKSASDYVITLTMPEDADSFVFCFSDISYHKRFTGTMDLDL